MLRTLDIANFAIIDRLEIEFERGFSVISGETGTGKSILIDAIGLLLGDRAEPGLVKAGAERAELSACFDVAADSPAARWLADQAMANGQAVLIRRIMPASGASRAWINGSVCTIGQLAELGALLVEIHGQHAHQQLPRRSHQRTLLDRLVDPSVQTRVDQAWQQWDQARRDLEALTEAGADPEQLEFLRFQLRELEELGLEADEYGRLEEEQERLSRADEIVASAARTRALIDDEQQPNIRALLQQALGMLEDLGAVDPILDQTRALLDEARINIDEAMHTVDKLVDVEIGDPERLAAVNRRLERALELARKHRVPPEQLAGLRTQLAERLRGIENAERQHAELQALLDQAETRWRELAQKLSGERQRAADQLVATLGPILDRLGMAQSVVEIEVSPDLASQPSSHGLDRVAIRFSANPGQPAQEVGRVASGGELSRLGLALMVAIRSDDGPQVRIFDEVDAGVGGETAHAVGEFLAQAAGHGQALCVTHLAQVAARADHQFRVSKQVSGKQTRTDITHLNGRERVQEIARMLGSADSQRSLAHAEEMLASRETRATEG